MCGRFENRVTFESISVIFSENGIIITEKQKDKVLAEEDIKPTNTIQTIVKEEDDYLFMDTKWGIKFSDRSPLIFNSRIETITEKPFWKNSFSKKRALVPMTGFYEWTLINKKKVQCRISLPGEDFFFVPALYHKQKDTIFTSLVTTIPNTFMKKIHHRMPVILTKKNAVDLMEADIEEAINMCVPYKGKMEIDEFHKR